MRHEDRPPEKRPASTYRCGGQVWTVQPGESHSAAWSAMMAASVKK